MPACPSTPCADTYDQACALRAVASTDGMTADYYPFDHAFLGWPANRIINEVRGINRVTHWWSTDVHHSRLCAVLIDCKTDDVDAAAAFWAEALGRPVDPGHPGTRGDYRMLETPPDEPIVQIQRVAHESRAHLDIETDDIPAEVARLEALGAKVARRLERWVVMEAPTGQRFCVVRVQRPGFPKNANRWG